MPTFTVLRDQQTLANTVYDVQLTDTANPFGDFCVFKLDDSGGSRFDEYARGTRVDIDIDPDDETLTVQAGETITTDAGTTDTYTTVNNAGTYENAGTVTAGTGTVEDRFTGYVVERRELEQNGADVLEVEAYSFDQFLRRNTVTNDQRGNTIREALEDIVTTDTPVTFEAANVSVSDDQELTRSYRGDRVENALRDFAFKSGNEEFGVNDQLEFFFRPREARHIDRGIDRTQWFGYDIPELGKETINEVEVWYNGGDESVVVDDGTDKLDLQDSLGLEDPGTQRAELQRPLITDVGDAEDIGRKFLKFRTSTLSGDITTFDLFDAEPGDTIDVTIPSRGIDTEFLIASLTYRWGRDETELTIVEQRGDVDDILADLNDSVQRNEMEGANRDGVQNRITTTNATALVDVDVVADAEGPNVLTVDSGETFTVSSGQTETFDTVENAGTVSNQATLEAEDSPVTVTEDGDRLVNDGRRAVRDAWTGDAPPDVTTLVVGTDNAGLSRSNTTLRNRVETQPVTQSLPDATSVQFEADVGENGVAELGLEAADGTLLARTIFDSPVDLAGTVTVTLSVDNDDSVSRGVITTDGQTAVRDALANNAPALPADYVYGAGDSPVSESDTSLDNTVVTASLEKVLIQSADGQSDWVDLLTIPETKPLYRENGQLKVAQTAFVQEGETDTITGTRGSQFYSGGFATFIDSGSSSNGDSATVDFTLDHEIPESNVAVNFRTEPIDGTGDGISNTPEFEVRIDGTSLGTEQFNTNSLDLRWRDFSFSWQSGALTPGNHTLTIEVTDAAVGDAGDELRFDLFSVYDDRFSPTFDNDNGGNDGFLDGPELFPPQIVQSFPTAEARRNVFEAQAEVQANDVSNNFFIELSGDGGTSFTRVSNSRTANVTFSNATQQIDANIGLGRTDETRTTATPQTGFNEQTVDVWELFAFPEAVARDDIGAALTRGIVPPNTITGETIREAGVKSGSTLLTRHVLAEFAVLADQRLASAETTTFTGTE